MTPRLAVERGRKLPSTRHSGTPWRAARERPTRSRRRDVREVAGTRRRRFAPAVIRAPPPVWTGGETPVIAAGAETPKIAAGMATPSAAQIAAHQAMQSNVPLTPEQYQQMRYQREIEERNRPQTDEELDELLPSEGFKIIDPPASYVPISERPRARKLICRRRCRMAPTQVSFQFQRRTAGKSLTSVSHQKVYPR